MRFGKIGSRPLFKYWTARDYVQNGLVAMWDGIENASWGVHNPNATVWKDLVGSNDVGSFVNGVNFGDNYIHIPATRAAATFTPYEIGYIQTVEIVIKATENNNEMVFVSFSSGSNEQANRWFGIDLKPSFSFGNRGDYASVSTPSNPHYYAGTSTSTATYMVPFSGLYLDGELVTKKPGGFWWSSQTPAGRFNSTPGQIVASDIYAIRLYSRELTAEEIAHNYAVDKARFNLP